MKARKRDEWLAGYAAALANVHRTHRDSTTVAHVLIGDGLTLVGLVAAGAEAHDTEEIGRALKGSDPASVKARGDSPADEPRASKDMRPIARR